MALFFGCCCFKFITFFVNIVSLFRYEKCFGKAVIFILAHGTACAMGQYSERNAVVT